MSDRIAVMDQGQLLQVGAPEEIYQRPRNRFVADFIGDTNLLPATVADGRTATLSDGTAIRVSVDRARTGAVTVAIRPEHLGLRRPDTERDSSLDAFHGRVDRVTFLGNATLYEVTADAGEPPVHVRVRQGNAPGIEHFAVGDPVRVRWAPASATVLED
jgi:spermidine/putrescine transport system ATP-binding protein